MPIVLEPTVKRLDSVVLEADLFHAQRPDVRRIGRMGLAAEVRDRNIGIWNRVFLTTSGDVTISDPFVITDLPLLPDVSRADLTVKAQLRNNSGSAAERHVAGKDRHNQFAEPATLGPHETLPVTLDKTTHPASRSNPKLWWPNGYGPNFYDFSLRFETDEGRCRT